MIPVFAGVVVPGSGDPGDSGAHGPVRAGQLDGARGPRPSAPSRPQGVSRAGLFVHSGLIPAAR